MPHAALHLHIGMQPAALLPVEWTFHAGAIVAIFALLWALSTSLRSAVVGDDVKVGERTT